jgi:eukaryotic-like serine/threonine-protein kinase
MIGETVTHYRILDKIGEGGMGVVYRAEDTRLGRQVAVKFLSAKLAQDPLALERFQREARAASSLNHPNICALYDVGRHGDQPFLVMELLAGTTLRQRISGSPLPLDTLLDLASQIADALDAAHSVGIVHRDIKSSNIYVTDRGQVKILDFGLVKLLHPGEPAAGVATETTRVHAIQATETGLTLGTLAYMSPEQARGEEIDNRSDLFSLGVVLYEMATGREPFAERTSVLTLDAILHLVPPAPSTINPRIPAELDRIIGKALEKDRELRYQTAAELRGDLKRLKRESEPTRLLEAVSTSRAAPPPRSRRRLAVAAAAVLVAALAVAISWDLLRGTSSASLDSIAVLPFAAANSSGDINYLSDGITQSLINGLAQLPSLRVSAWGVVSRYKGQQGDPQKIGRDLKVKTVVTGSVATIGGQLVIEAGLMNVADGTQIWGSRYNRPAADLLTVQDDIASQILDKLRPQLSGADKQRVTKRYTDDPEAYQLYLHGRYLWNQGTIAGYQQAIEYFQQAIDRDPRYALAEAGLADSYLSLGSYWVESLTEAKAAAERALEVDPNLSEAHVALGHIKLSLDWDWPAAEREFKRGIELDPRSPLAHTEYAMYLATRGNLSDAMAEVKKARDLDAGSPVVNTDLGWLLLFAGQRADAIAQFGKTLDFDPNSVWAHEGLGIAYSLEGRPDEAVAQLEQAVTLSQTNPLVLGQLGAAYARAGRSADARATLARLQTLAAREYVPSSAAAVIYAALGDPVHAIDQLEQAYTEHDFSLIQIRVAPWWQALRGEPRFEQLVTRLGLPQ